MKELCGAHTSERVGEGMKSQKIQKGRLFHSVDEKGVLILLMTRVFW